MGRAKGKEHAVFSPQMANNIEIKSVDWLKPYDRNARTHSETQLDEIAASIAEFGFTNPILANADGTIIAGHGRLEASTKRLGLKEVPVVILDYLTDAQQRAYIIADNKIALNAGWDDDVLGAELHRLEKEGFNLELTGFDSIELEDILSPFEEDIAEDEEGEGDGEGENIEPPENPVSALGDFWILGKHRLLCGDSTSPEALAILMGDDRADLVFTDPPYGVDYEGITNDDRKGLKTLLEGAMKNIEKFSKKGAGVYMFHSDKCADIFHEVFRRFCHFSSMIIWVKPALVLSQSDYHSKHEPCLYGWLNNGTHKWYGDRSQTSVWQYGKESVKGHTTPKPTELICNALENSSLKNGIVLDPFGGSGSTLLACQKTGRRARLVELEPKYCDVIVRRWQDQTGEKAILESTGRTFANMKAERTNGKAKK